MLKKTLPIAAVISVALFSIALPSKVLAADEAKTNQFWWPEQLNLSPLRQHSAESNPYSEQFNYAKAVDLLFLSIGILLIAIATYLSHKEPKQYKKYVPKDAHQT